MFECVSQFFSTIGRVFTVIDKSVQIIEKEVDILAKDQEKRMALANIDLDSVGKSTKAAL